MRYAPTVIGEKRRVPKEGLSVVRINFKSNPIPSQLFWTLPDGTVIKMGGRSSDNKFASGIIHPVSQTIIDEWLIELWIDVNDIENNRLEAQLTIVNDIGANTHSFIISSNSSFWTMPVLIAMSMGGLLFFVGIVVILIFLITQKMQDTDSNLSDSDSEESINLKCDDLEEKG